MSRTSNCNSTVATVVKSAVRTWYIAIYIRLSKEKLDEKDKDESQSVTNQRAIIERHINGLKEKYGDEYVIVDEYVDDGVSGTTDEERDDFMRMIRDIRSGVINCVIVKDLSRSFRNVGDQTYYLDDWFPRSNIRFISLSHQEVDSYFDPKSVRNIAVPIQGVINESHAAQTSDKVRDVFDMKRRNGEFIGGFAPYGYMKDPQYKGSFIIDPVAAETVKYIFNRFLSGGSKSGIARQLNDQGVPCPAAYKQNVQGLNYKTPAANATYDFMPPLWSMCSINHILKNQCYCGDMVQGRYKIVSYKVHVQKRMPEDEWYIVKNTHEAIIDRKSFQRVQELLKRDTRIAPGKKAVYPFAGLLRCADCGKSMSRSTSKGKGRYYCGTYKNNSKNACSSHAINERDLMAAVLYAVQQQIHLAVSYTEAVEIINASPAQNSHSKRLADALAQKEMELTKSQRLSRKLYMDYTDENITLRLYKQMNEELEQEIVELEKSIQRLQGEIDDLETGFDGETECLVEYRKYQNLTKLTREVITALIDQITIFEDGIIKIKFRFRKQMAQVKEYVELNSHSEAV